MDLDSCIQWLIGFGSGRDERIRRNASPFWRAGVICFGVAGYRVDSGACPSPLFSLPSPPISPSPISPFSSGSGHGAAATEPRKRGGSDVPPSALGEFTEAPLFFPCWGGWDSFLGFLRCCFTLRSFVPLLFLFLLWIIVKIDSFHPRYFAPTACGCGHDDICRGRLQSISSFVNLFLVSLLWLLFFLIVSRTWS